MNKWLTGRSRQARVQTDKEVQPRQTTSIGRRKNTKKNRQLKTKIQNVQENAGTSDAQGIKSEGKTHKYSKKGRRVNNS